MSKPAALNGSSQGFSGVMDEEQQNSRPSRAMPISKSSPHTRSNSRQPRTLDISEFNEETSLLTGTRAPNAHYSTSPTSLQHAFGPRRQSSWARPTNRMRKAHSRAGTITSKFASAFGLADSTPASGKASFDLDDSVLFDLGQGRLWYDQFTTIDWVRDNIADSERQKSLRNLSGFRGRTIAASHAAESWVLAGLIGCLTAVMAYVVDVSETWLFDIKFGHCSTAWFSDRQTCCLGTSSCKQWVTWGQMLGSPASIQRNNFLVYVLLVIVFATSSCIIAMTVRLRVPVNLSSMRMGDDLVLSSSLMRKAVAQQPQQPPSVTYPATGSGVAEVRVILSGFVLHGYLGLRTLVVKTLSLILSVASGLALGKEGPYVHISTAIANVVARISPKYRANDGKRREMISAGAATGVAVAFGAPISGVLFSLEEVSYYFPSKTLFRTFFSSIVAAVVLKLLNPYGTSKIVPFQVHYTKDWHAFETCFFILLGVIGGAIGACFIKTSRWWASRFRGLRLIKSHPLLEVFLVALFTGVTTFWGRYTSRPVTELMLELSSECMSFDDSRPGLCPDVNTMVPEAGQLMLAFVLKAVLTTITFGLKVPAGIYIPSMVLGGLFGRCAGHIAQYAVMKLASPTSEMFGTCAASGDPEDCVVPGVYALIAAGATMCGVTRLTVTIVIIMFELSGSIDHVLPFSIAVLAAKWTADAVEPLSIYDLLTETNNYPFLDAKTRPLGLTGELADITQKPNHLRVIDISDAPAIRASVLREKLIFLAEMGELDGGIPIVQHDLLVGLIATQDLEYAIDRLDRRRDNVNSELLTNDSEGADAPEDPRCWFAVREAWPPGRSNDAANELIGDETDLTPFIDPSPIALDVHSSMELVYECFQKLGLRYVCVSREGLHAGLVHKKTFVHWVREHKE